MDTLSLDFQMQRKGIRCWVEDLTIFSKGLLYLLDVYPEKPWVNLFSTNRLAGRGINLNYIAPIIVEGENVLENFG